MHPDKTIIPVSTNPFPKPLSLFLIKWPPNPIKIIARGKKSKPIPMFMSVTNCPQHFNRYILTEKQLKDIRSGPAEETFAKSLRLISIGGDVMNKMFLVCSLLLLGAGCSHDEMPGKTPPVGYMVIGDEKHEGVQGSYCWNTTCADTAGPPELMKGHKPVVVKPGESFRFTLDFEPKPNEFHLTQFQGDKETDVSFDGGEVTAPLEEGVYHYAYSVWWMDEEEEHLSHGDSSYAFSIKVVE